MTIQIHVIHYQIIDHLIGKRLNWAEKEFRIAVVNDRFKKLYSEKISIVDYSLVCREWFNKSISFEDVDRSVLQSVNVQIVDLSYDSDYDDRSIIDFSVINKWRVNHIYFQYDNIGPICGGPHISFSDLFGIKSLQSIEIKEIDYIDIKDIKWMVNDHLESFKVAAVLSLMG
ncbi:hypothetical protein PPL_02863 [Heterostelium album PN500]|uniref:Uncharacterized protein n=1 Tax=Heterostelium pallidum (strain ATCC 26659 / Pp 5 / PN500) TaxID=670386 RepID=D3B397_HETP5|nr:hypothetical protein PPL_02863 [Heterostelium album PN500]EFA83795.1 hypothetical protein PPL_02863 [Heterostelium album PN500]|eukprot:XP_020435912.1 hypothetical protein PPL_02863 [Heterostelium album PN500]